MAKTCTICGTDNRDEAKFCRGCGTPFSAASVATPPDAGKAAADGGRVCLECAYVNQTGVHYCAKCGGNLAGAAGSPPSAAAEPATRPGAATPSALPATQRKRVPLAIALVAAALVIGAGTAWWRAGFGTAAQGVPTEPAPVTAPEAPPGDPAEPLATTPAPAIATPLETMSTAHPGDANTPPAPQSAVASSVPTAQPATQAPVMPAAEPPAAKVAKPPAHGDLDAQHRATLEKKARDKAARAERDAKARALIEQREQARLAEQEAARRRAEEQRQIPVTLTAPAPAVPRVVPAQPRGVADLCADRNPIRQGICEARECMGAAHAAEAVCRRLREIDDQRRQGGG